MDLRSPSPTCPLARCNSYTSMRSSLSQEDLECNSELDSMEHSYSGSTASIETDQDLFYRDSTLGLYPNLSCSENSATSLLGSSRTPSTTGSMRISSPWGTGAQCSAGDAYPGHSPQMYGSSSASDLALVHTTSTTLGSPSYQDDAIQYETMRSPSRLQLHPIREETPYPPMAREPYVYATHPGGSHYGTPRGAPSTAYTAPSVVSTDRGPWESYYRDSHGIHAPSALGEPDLQLPSSEELYDLQYPQPQAWQSATQNYVGPQPDPSTVGQPTTGSSFGTSGGGPGSRAGSTIAPSYARRAACTAVDVNIEADKNFASDRLVIGEEEEEVAAPDRAASTSAGPLRPPLDQSTPVPPQERSGSGAAFPRPPRTHSRASSSWDSVSQVPSGYSILPRDVHGTGVHRRIPAVDPHGCPITREGRPYVPHLPERPWTGDDTNANTLASRRVPSQVITMNDVLHPSSATQPINRTLLQPRVQQKPQVDERRVSDDNKQADSEGDLRDMAGKFLNFLKSSSSAPVDKPVDGPWRGKPGQSNYQQGTHW